MPKPRTHDWSGIACCVLLLCGASVPAGAQQAGSRRAVAAMAASSRGSALTESAFAREQLQYSRVRKAQRTAGPRIVQAFADKNIRHPAAEVYVRAFKREGILELWVRPAGTARFQLLNSYPICAQSGEPGPKQRQGDGQVPEGFYTIDLFNPFSAYHLSLRINYPNQRDRIVNRGRRMGGDIYIHGGCRSIGCLAVTDGGIEELYWIAVEARAAGQRQIPVHIFPSRLGPEDVRHIKADFRDRPDLLAFWKTLQPAYDYFEMNRRVPRVAVDARGTYRLAAD